MKINQIFLLLLVALGLATACRRDEISFEQPSQPLAFSRDTLVLDTVYNQVRSETYAVKVYNREDKEIRIPKISLEGGSASSYRINVDGRAGTDFTDVPLRAKDSLYIFVEIAPVANATEAIAEDRILFSSNAGNQYITLLSVVQDAEFYIQSSSNVNVLNDDTVWRNDKAKIIYGNLTLAEGKTLDIEAGTKVYFTKNSSFKISKNAQLNINGTLGNEVLFRGDRNDPRYDTIPLNWKGIEMAENAVLNMNYAKVFGGETALKMDNATANIRNSIIHSFQEYGIYAVASNITAENMVMNNCGEANLGIFKGGNINLTHCTIANYWRMNTATPVCGIYATNEYKNASGGTENGNLTLRIYNSILYGTAENALTLVGSSGYQMDYLLSHCLVKYGEDAGYSFAQNPLVINSISNEEPEFLFPYIRKMNLALKRTSPARERASASSSTDIRGVQRGTTPNIGAYE